MKLRPKRARLSEVLFIHPEGAPRPFWVDRDIIKSVRRIRWTFIPEKKRARGFFGRSRVRMYLHRYVLYLAGKYYPEVTFANGNYYDCRLVNLKPYRREEEGATRRLFKNSSTRIKGVCFRKGKWVSMIRIRGKLRNLGTFDDPDLAAKAYQNAWELAHPDLELYQ